MTESAHDREPASDSELEWVDDPDASAVPAAPPTERGVIPVPAMEPQATDLGMRMLLPLGRSPLAIIAGYLGLFSLLIVPGPLALLFGILAVVHIRRGTNVHGMGRAIFAIVIGALATLVLVIAIIEIAMEAGR